MQRRSLLGSRMKVRLTLCTSRRADFGSGQKSGGSSVGILGRGTERGPAAPGVQSAGWAQARPPDSRAPPRKGKRGARGEAYGSPAHMTVPHPGDPPGANSGDGIGARAKERHLVRCACALDCTPLPEESHRERPRSMPKGHLGTRGGWRGGGQGPGSPRPQGWEGQPGLAQGHKVS